MEGRELGGQDVGGAFEDVFGVRGRVEVPDLDQAGGVLGGAGVFGVCCYEELWKL